MPQTARRSLMPHDTYFQKVTRRFEYLPSNNHKPSPKVRPPKDKTEAELHNVLIATAAAKHDRGRKSKDSRL